MSNVTSIFKSFYFLKWCPIFDTSLLIQFSKFNNFLWVCWLLCKNLSNFVPPVWKLHNPCCHNIQLSKLGKFILLAHALLLGKMNCPQTTEANVTKTRQVNFMTWKKQKIYTLNPRLSSFVIRFTSNCYHLK